MTNSIHEGAELTDDIRVVQDFYDALTGGDIRRSLGLLAADCTVSEPDSLPYGGVHRGPDSVRKLFSSIWSIFAVEFHEYVVKQAGDSVFCRLECTFTSRESGHSVRVPAVEVHAVRNGRITEIEIFLKDTHAILALNASEHELRNVGEECLIKGASWER